MASDFSDIPSDLSLKYHPDYNKISQKARQRGLNYFLQGYIHEISIKTDNNIILIKAKCYRSYRKSQSPHHLRVDIDNDTCTAFFLNKTHGSGLRAQIS